MKLLSKRLWLIRRWLANKMYPDVAHLSEADLVSFRPFARNLFSPDETWGPIESDRIYRVSKVWPRCAGQVFVEIDGYNYITDHRLWWR